MSILMNIVSFFDICKVIGPKDPTDLWTDDEDEDDINDKPKSQGRVYFCDLAVYGTNKSMRMFLSRKFGEKKEPFILADDCHFYDPRRADEILCRQILIDSLIEIVDSNESVLLDFVDLDNSMVNDNKAINIWNYSFTTRPFVKMQIERASDMPELDKQVVQYLQDVLLFHNAEDELEYPIIIRDRKITPDGRYLIFNFKNYNFCQNINRRHRSNQIKIVADLTRAVVYQKCYDPECWWFRSNFQPLDRNERLEGEISQFSSKFLSRFNSGEQIWRGFEGKREDYDIEVILKPFSKLNV
uniref:DNA-directed primase/polymerase protein n=1 Tax=Romanomermis culicivorax TaxID=13658 RepID=A0A915HRD9_ROMCU